MQVASLKEEVASSIEVLRSPLGLSIIQIEFQVHGSPLRRESDALDVLS
jgi:hypothetical protein